MDPHDYASLQGNQLHSSENKLNRLVSQQSETASLGGVSIDNSQRGYQPRTTDVYSQKSRGSTGVRRTLAGATTMMVKRPKQQQSSILNLGRKTSTVSETAFSLLKKRNTAKNQVGSQVSGQESTRDVSKSSPKLLDAKPSIFKPSTDEALLGIGI
mgnify:CR=1 FL=1